MDRSILSVEKQSNKNVGLFFESYAKSFDSIYGHNNKRSIIGRINDRFFRRAMYSRFEKTINIIKNDDINSILDVGCGSGRYCLEYLKYNKSVVGIDLAEEMLKISKHLCESNYPDGDFHFIHDDYLNYTFNKKFEVSILMGLFDYISDPKLLIKKLSKDTSKIILGSFPKFWNILTLQRSIRYKIRKCPLFFYTKNQIKRLLNDLGLDNYEIVNNGREYYVKIILNNNI